LKHQAKLGMVQTYNRNDEFNRVSSAIIKC